MSKETDIQGGEKRIEQLTDHEVGWIYTLATHGKWPDSKIAPFYKISPSDVSKVIDIYVERQRTAEKKLCRQEQPRQDPSPERIEKKPRKRRRDARYATTADRQAAYRARMKEKRRASLEQPSPANETDPPGPDVEELPATFCQDPVTETSPENADPQYSTCDSSSSTALAVTAGLLKPNG